MNLSPAISRSNLAIHAYYAVNGFIGSAHSGSRFVFTNTIGFPQMFSIILDSLGDICFLLRTVAHFLLG